MGVILAAKQLFAFVEPLGKPPRKSSISFGTSSTRDGCTETLREWIIMPTKAREAWDQGSDELAT